MPWRESPSPYKTWISEMMLQQTTVAAVIPYFEKWMDRFPTIADIAKASLDEILNLWQGLGYYNRARYIHQCSNIFCEKHNGEIPNSEDILKNYPGFGPYTTAAVLSLGFGQKLPLLDANVRRVMSRILLLKERNTLNDKKILQSLEKVLPAPQISEFNQGMMEMGALICKPKTPQCLICPIETHCQAKKEGLQDSIPNIQKKIIKPITVVVALLKKDNEFFMQKRPEKTILGGLWEFPGGKQEKGESLEKTLVREIKEELNISISRLKFFTKVKHFYTSFAVTLHAFFCEHNGEPYTSLENRWVSLDEIKKLALPSGSVKIINKLRMDTPPP